MAILLPFTYGLKPMVAMCFLASIMGAVPFGGSITATLLNTPGNAGNAATCLDGHPMARKGEAKKLLEMSATATAFGSLFGVFVLILLLPAVGKIILLFGPPSSCPVFVRSFSRSPCFQRQLLKRFYRQWHRHSALAFRIQFGFR